jgi:hypothetical protein
MKMFLMQDDKRFKLSTPFEGSDHAVVDGEACPHCKVNPFKIAGSGKHIADDDRAYQAEGYCLACKKHVGVIRAEPSTLFGLHEDEAMLHGRCRVY